MSEENARFFTLRFWPTLPIEPRAIGQLPQIRVPTLVVEGEADSPLNRRGSQLLASGIPGARLVLVHGAAHMIPMEKPDEFNRVVLEFLGSVRKW
jgi:pimeloyl-ACP methyl ester carboxylesterase